MLIWVVPLGASAMRERQSLEAYELSTLKFDSFHREGGCTAFAFIRDPKGYLHRVFEGDYVGKRFGRVVELTDKGLRLLEAIQRTDGEWVQREVWLLKRGAENR